MKRSSRPLRQTQAKKPRQKASQPNLQTLVLGSPVAKHVLQFLKHGHMVQFRSACKAMARVGLQFMKQKYYFRYRHYTEPEARELGKQFLRVSLTEPMYMDWIGPWTTHLRIKWSSHMLDDRESFLIPPSVTHLETNCPWKTFLQGPLKSLKTWDLLPEDKDNLIQEGLTHLFLSESSVPLQDLPKSLRHLSLGSEFDQPLTQLPQNLTHLIFDSEFNQELKNLPPCLQVLVLGYKFNQPLDSLPDQLKSLTLGSWYNMSCYSRSLARLPSGLNELSLTFCTSQMDPSHPCLGSLNQLPPGLKKLHVYVLCVRPGAIPLDNLPPALESLDINCYNGPVDQLPQGLKEVRLIGSFNQSISGLPDSVQSLTLGNHFVQPIDKVPKALRRLCLGILFAHDLLVPSDQRYSLLLMNPLYEGQLDPKFLNELIVPACYSNKLQEWGAPHIDLPACSKFRLTRMGPCIWILGSIQLKRSRFFQTGHRPDPSTYYPSSYTHLKPPCLPDVPFTMNTIN